MSGGSFDYFYCMLQEHVGNFGDKELDELVRDLATLFHDREWFLFGDTCEGDWNESRDAFKAKWFTDAGRQDRIEKYLADFTNEVKRSFGISSMYCWHCKHWSKGSVEKYGKCDFVNGCLMHEMEYCDKWEEREK